MAESTRIQISDQVFDSILDRQATLYDSIRNAADRYHRFNRSLIEGARQNNRDWTEVTRRFLTNPTDASAVYEAVADAVGNSQARTIALAREWLEDRVEAQRESREVLNQSVGDVRDAIEQAQANAPAFLKNWGRRRNGREEPAAAAR